MPQIGPLEILVVGFVALLVFGPERLPEMARNIGKGINQMKKMASDVKSEFDMNLADEAETASAATTSETPPVSSNTMRSAATSAASVEDVEAPEAVAAG